MALVMLSQYEGTLQEQRDGAQGGTADGGGDAVGGGEGGDGASGSGSGSSSEYDSESEGELEMIERNPVLRSLRRMSMSQASGYLQQHGLALTLPAPAESTALEAGPAGSEQGSAPGLGPRPDVEAEPEVECKAADAARRVDGGQEPVCGTEGAEPAESAETDGIVLRFAFPGVFDSLDDAGA